MPVCGLLSKQQSKTPNNQVLLFGVRHLQIMGGFSDPFEQSMPLLEYLLRGIKSDQAKKGMTAVRTRHTVHLLYAASTVGMGKGPREL